MKLRRGNMFSALNKCDVLLVTTNAYVRTDGGLVMGRGAAYTMTQKYPGSQKEFGMLVSFHAKTHDNEPYGVLLSPMWHKPRLGIFQVKYRYDDKADLGLIEISTQNLKDCAEAHPDEVFAVNYPGIGNGGLPVAQVKPIVDTLPDNVEVWIL